MPCLGSHLSSRWSESSIDCVAHVDDVERRQQRPDDFLLDDFEVHFRQAGPDRQSQVSADPRREPLITLGFESVVRASVSATLEKEA